MTPPRAALPFPPQRKRDAAAAAVEASRIAASDAYLQTLVTRQLWDRQEG